MGSDLTGLEQLWKANKKKSYRSLFGIPKLPDIPDRPSKLRGRDLVFELCRYALLTKDERFTDAVTALFEHKIINQNWNFTQWIPEEWADRDQRINRIKVAGIATAVREHGMTVRKAVAMAAALIGEPAVSFEAACKRLKTLYYASQKTVQRDRKPCRSKLGKIVRHDYSHDSK
jgi:hypothetical protein